MPVGAVFDSRFDGAQGESQSAFGQGLRNRLGATRNVAFNELGDRVHASVRGDLWRQANGQFWIDDHDPRDHQLGPQAFFIRRIVRGDDGILGGFTPRPGRRGDGQNGKRRLFDFEPFAHAFQEIGDAVPVTVRGQGGDRFGQIDRRPAAQGDDEIAGSRREFQNSFDGPIDVRDERLMSERGEQANGQSRLFQQGLDLRDDSGAFQRFRARDDKRPLPERSGERSELFTAPPAEHHTTGR